MKTISAAGIGRQLVEWTIDEARRLGIRRLMALTYEQRFFEKLGFEVVAKETLPLKVWSDCVRCPKRDGCDEIADGAHAARRRPHRPARRRPDAQRRFDSGAGVQ